MVDSWAVLVSTAMILFSLCIIAFNLIPTQFRLVFTNNDNLNWLRRLLVVSSISIAMCAAPILMGRALREFFGITNILLNDVITLAVGGFYLSYAVSWVLVYRNKGRK